MATNADYRKQFLIKYYSELWGSINRNIVTMWQSISIVIAAFAILGLVEKQIIELSVAVSLMVLLILWFAAHLIDASYWFNRNLVIIENVERQFLTKKDLKDIQFYFGNHRPGNRIIRYFVIQLGLGFGLLFITLSFHILKTFFPSAYFVWPTNPLDYLPYLILFVGLILLGWHIRSRNSAYDEILRKSPGRKTS